MKVRIVTTSGSVLYGSLIGDEMKAMPKKEALNEAEISLNSRKLPEYTRVPLTERLKQLDNVGHCLSKGDGA